VKAARLEKLAFQIKYPLPSEVRSTISRGVHGTTPIQRHRMELRTASSARVRTKMRFHQEMGRCRMTERAASCLPKIESETIRRDITYPERPPKTAKADSKSLSQDALEGLNTMVWKLEDQFPTLSAAFRSFDKDRSGCITANEFQKELYKLQLNLSQETMVEIMAYIDVNGDGQLEFHEVVGAVNEALAEFHKHHWMDRILKYHADKNDAASTKAESIVEAVPCLMIVESVNTKCQNRIPEMQANFNFMRLKSASFARQTEKIQDVPRSAFVNKSEMASIFFKSNVSILPRHFNVWWNSLAKTENHVKWSSFVEAIGRGKTRGRGSYPMHDVHAVDPIAELANGPEIECLRHPDVLSSPNRWDL
jgi:hypothetical protein